VLGFFIWKNIVDSQSALKELQTFQSGRKSAGDYYTAAQQELGVGSAQQRASDMRNLIRNTEGALKGVDASVSGRTQGSLVTEAQRSRLANLERQPLSEELGTLQGGYSDEMANYRDLVGQASTKAGLGYQSDQDRLASLEGNYNRLFGQEQAAEERRRYEADLVEKKRQFDTQQASMPQYSFGQGGQTTPGSAAKLEQRADKGFNFKDASGKPISAAQYAQIKGIEFRALLQQMANAGDKGAQQSLGYVGNDFGYNRAKVGGNQGTADLLNSLMWGVNRVDTGSNLQPFAAAANKSIAGFR
jgi:hypothetical protein